ncbi:MAG: hypothetical protein QOE48_2389 [Mycobacterium sp.]|jgi:pimeloyl-ACP methyl ester carboxylesterase|nr:hypothetical protein [Mycobacterium sp.]
MLMAATQSWPSPRRGGPRAPSSITEADKLTAPTQILWGKKDKAAPLIGGRATLKLLPHSELEIIDTGHVVFSSAPEAFLRVVEPFLASLPVDPPVERR